MFIALAGPLKVENRCFFIFDTTMISYERRLLRPCERRPVSCFLVLQNSKHKFCKKKTRFIFAKLRLHFEAKKCIF